MGEPVEYPEFRHPLPYPLPKTAKGWKFRWPDEDRIEIAWRVRDLVAEADWNLKAVQREQQLNRNIARYYLETLFAPYEVQRELYAERISWTHARNLAHYGQDDHTIQHTWLQWIFTEEERRGAQPTGTELAKLLGQHHPRPPVDHKNPRQIWHPDY